MKNKLKLVIKCSIFGLLLSISYHFPLLSSLVVYLIAIAITSLFGIYFGIKFNRKAIIDDYHKSHLNPVLMSSSLVNRPNLRKTDKEVVENYFQTRTLVSANVDQLMEQMTNYCLRDFVFIWYKDLVNEDNDTIELKLKNDFWEVIFNAVIRIRSIDFLKFFTKNVVNRCLKHFQKITLCLANSKENQNNSYLLSSHLSSKEEELEFIRKLSEFLLTILLPKNYSKSKPLLHLLREIISVQMLNAINLICDPIYLNQKLLDYLKWHKMETERHKQTYAYSETYEQFIEMINKCCDVEDLKRIRFQIITEVMEATVINNLKKERGIDMSDKMFSGPISSAKGDLLQARNLKRYINQLTFAKNQCEKRINAINTMNGGHCLHRHVSQNTSDTLPQPNRKTVLGFKVIMDSDICRSYLKKFMQYSLISSSSSPESRRHLLVFWESVEQMTRQEDAAKQYEMANEILNHLNFKSGSIKLMNLSKNTLKAMEEFVLGNRGAEAFIVAQNMVYEILEHRYYPLFIVSKEYEQMLDQIQDTLENSGESLSRKTRSDSDISEVNSTDSREQSVVSISENSIVEIHVSQTKLKLENLSQKLNDKTNALKALRKSESEKATKSVVNVNQKLIKMLEKEIEDIERESQQLSAHLECTQMWISGMGKWRADVHNIEMDLTEGLYLVIIIVHRNDMSETSNGWIVGRNLQHFHDLRRKMIKIVPNIKSVDIPKVPKKFTANKTQLEAIKRKLQTFLKELTQNEKTYRSEDLFLFLSQSSDSLRQPIGKLSHLSNPMSKLFPLAKLFGVSQTIERQSSFEKETKESDKNSVDIESQFLILNDLENEDNIKDDIAEPLYDLISEIFELRTISKWLRRSLMTFVQMTYGQTINKQLRSTVEWICSESMIHYYLTSLRDSLWPNGCLSEPWPQSSEEVRKRVQLLAKQHLLNSIPEVINTLLGQQNVKKGIVKVFDGLQNQMLNKQLFYEITETFVFEFAPELKAQ